MKTIEQKTRRLKQLAVSGLLLAGILTGSYFLFGSSFRATTQYNFVTLTKGSIESTISSSGTLSPVTQVEVGTQVSGTIDQVYVDFNDRVRKGQIIAVLDSSLLRIAVTEAESGVIRARAQLEEAELNFKRSEQLFAKGLVSEAEYQPVKTALKNAESNMITARMTLERAQRNLGYAIIRSPIDGTITARNVEAGQTVAASFSTPTLFVIARDLSKMEIKALVDESDIGQIKVGLRVRFTVQAYPNTKFTGTVKQVRVQPTTNSNVVNYTVIISAENNDGLLLPGMTAAVDFIIERREQVLLIPNIALRYQPSEKEIAAAMERMMKKAGPPPDSGAHRMPPPSADGNAGSPQASAMKQLWYQDGDGALAAVPAVTGISDGTNTEIRPMPLLKEGMKIIGSAAATTKAAAKTTTMQGGPPGGMPPPM